MIFASFEFAAFFLLVLLGRNVCRSRTRNNWLLLVASYVFYASWSLPCVLLFLVVSLVDYHVGIPWLRRPRVSGAGAGWL